jgi:anti-sigma B factor antagonist
MLVENRDDIVILAPRHRVDTNTSPEVEKIIFENIGDGDGKMVIDFSQVDYVSSAGLRVLLKTAKKMKKGGGKLGLCNLNDQIKEVLELSGFLGIIDCHDSVEACIATFV